MDRNAPWPHVSRTLIERRAAKGCMLPTPGDVMEAAVMALKEAAEGLAPARLFSAERTAALSGIHNNDVPEPLVTSAVAGDVSGEYRREYEAAARCNLDSTELSQDGIWQVVIRSYWRYLRESSGADVVDCGAAGGKTQSTLSIMLLWSTFGKKRLSKHPFKHKSANSNYKEDLEGLRGALSKIERYAYYMRPNDPMTRSENTALRLHEILAYVATCYRWLLWFMDLTDARVLKKMDKGPVITHGPRETRPPDELVRRHIKSGPGVSAGTGAALMLTTGTADALVILLRMSVGWTAHSWKSNTHGVTGAIVAAVELVTLLHHHLQYLINLVFAGYACWLDGGIDDSYLNSALRAQGRFDHFVGKLVPVMSAASWANMERGVPAWFRYALAKSLVTHGSPTQYYLGVLDSIAGQRAEAGERGEDGLSRRTASFSCPFRGPPQTPLPNPPGRTTASASASATRPRRGARRSCRPDGDAHYWGMSSLVAGASSHTKTGRLAAGADVRSALQPHDDGAWFMPGVYSAWRPRAESSSDESTAEGSSGTPYATLPGSPVSSEDERSLLYAETQTGPDEDRLVDGGAASCPDDSEYVRPDDEGLLFRADEAHYQRPRVASVPLPDTRRDPDYEHYMRPRSGAAVGEPRSAEKGEAAANEGGDEYENEGGARAEAPGPAYANFRPRSRHLDNSYGLPALAALSAARTKAINASGPRPLSDEAPFRRSASCRVKRFARSKLPARPESHLGSL
ncbi:tegument protein VP11/12 [Equid alphaherpesvirus 3]|uniref:Tegument protein UL46 homolog n=1 Tax=Equid alphaherpesvirus 3 TaxID=80341 RepID=A0A077B9N6_9ALPH|nr:tegument protein VP11/12 [Equid alphaherpesvirus 3]AIL02931.1 tegument protein VP11/12 [Equid alphaherpesvirus 3]